MNNIKNKAFSKLDEFDIKKVDYFNLSEMIISLSYNYKFENAKKTLFELFQRQDKNNLIENKSPILFFKAISKYLYYFNDYLNKNKENPDKIIKKEIKDIIKFIRKSIKYLQNHFDEEYLLIFNNLDDKIKFSTLENVYLLNFLEEISSVLNITGYNKQADYLFMLKNKIELGFNRYLYYKKYNLVIKGFYKNDYVLFLDNNIELLKILNEYFCDKKLLKFKIDSNNIVEKLLYIKLLKKINSKLFNTNIKDIQGILINFPEFIYSKNEFEKFFYVNKSINNNFVVNYKKKQDKNQFLMYTNSIKVINLFLQVIK